jgi:hypothetical protein
MPEEQKHIFQKFIPFAKVDAVKQECWGIVTAEVPDKSGEICDYASTKPYYKAWSEEFVKATDGKSCGNLRLMHTMRAVGKGIGIEFRDTDKEIWMGFRVTADDVWKDVEEGTLTGFSQGGKYVSGPDIKKRYTADPSEVSLVDNPALGVCHFAFIRADGAVEMRKVRSEPIPAEAAAAADKVSNDTELAPGLNALFDQMRVAVTKAAGDKPITRAEVEALLAKLPVRVGDPAPVVKRAAPEAAAAIALLKSALDQVKKGMYDVAQFAGLIDSLAWMQRISDFERESEGDESTVPAELLTLLGELCQTFLHMAAEETNELLTRPGSQGAGLFAQNATLRKASALLTKAAAKIKSKTATAGSPAEKENTTMSDLNKKAGLSDHLAAAAAMADEHNEKMKGQIAKCVGCLGGDKDAEKAALAELAKTAAAAAAAAAAPVAVVAVAADPSVELTKKFQGAFESVLGTMQTQFQAFMEKLANTLEPPKAAQTDTAAGRVISKTEDGKAAAAAAGTAAGAGTQEEPAQPVFVAKGSGAVVDPAVRDAMRALRGTAVS